MTRPFVLINLTFCLLISPAIVLGQVVINEFLADLPSSQNETQDEWVELYNTSSQPVDVAGYMLLDEKNNPLIIDLNHTNHITTVIEPGGFLVVYRKGAKFSLNNDKDSLYLYTATESGTLLDAVGYEKTKENYSAGRVPDGVGDLVSEMEPTPGIANKQPIISTPTPTATSTPSTAPTTVVNKLQVKPSPSLIAVAKHASEVTKKIDEEVALDSNSVPQVLGSEIELEASAASPPVLPQITISGEPITEETRSASDLISATQDKTSRHRWYFITTCLVWIIGIIVSKWRKR